ncbi:MAG TPA: DUF6600 domain-containing protein [Burkholderiales bacterium]|nr:DUF6600 domain-containing protein [Burkholderiales bacterium]
MSPEPAQLGRFSAVEGEVRIGYAEGDEDRDRASVNHPVASGARIVAGPSARAEIRIGPNALTLGGQALLDVVSLGEGTLQLRLDEGALILALRDSAPGGQVEVATPRASVGLLGPGTYRVDAEPGAASTRVAVRAGEAMVRFGDGEIPLKAGAGVTVSATAVIEHPVAAAPPQDDLERWAQAREAEQGAAVSDNIPPYVTGHEELDRNGYWSTYSGYGRVWTPGSAWGGWTPYTYGHWAWVPPWGWTWVDDAPWAFATFRFGHWAFLHGRWWWVPGGLGARPVFSGFVPFHPGQVIFTTSFFVHGKPAHHFVPLKPRTPIPAKRSLHPTYWPGETALPAPPAAVTPGLAVSPVAPGSAALRSQTTGLPRAIVSRGGADARVGGVAPESAAPLGSRRRSAESGSPAAPVHPAAPSLRRGPAADAPAPAVQAGPAPARTAAPVVAPLRRESGEGFRRGAPAASPWRAGVGPGDVRSPPYGARSNSAPSGVPGAVGGGLPRRDAAGVPLRGGGGIRGDSAWQGGGRGQERVPAASPMGTMMAPRQGGSARR